MRLCEADRLAWAGEDAQAYVGRLRSLLNQEGRKSGSAAAR